MLINLIRNHPKYKMPPGEFNIKYRNSLFPQVSFVTHAERTVGDLHVSLVLTDTAVLRGRLRPVSFSANTLNSYSVASSKPPMVNCLSLIRSLLLFFQALSPDCLYSTQYPRISLPPSHSGFSHWRVTLSFDIERISSSPGWLGLSEIFKIIEKRINGKGKNWLASLFFVLFGNSLLTKGIFANNWFRSRAGLAKTNVILCDDTELIFSIGNEAGDSVHRGGYLGFVVSDPLVSGCLLAFNVVACHSRAAVIFRSRP